MINMYACLKCKQEYDDYPESRKCVSCGGKVFYKKRIPVIRKVKTD